MENFLGPWILFNHGQEMDNNKLHHNYMVILLFHTSFENNFFALKKICHQLINLLVAEVGFSWLYVSFEPDFIYVGILMNDINI